MVFGKTPVVALSCIFSGFILGCSAAPVSSSNAPVTYSSQWRTPKGQDSAIVTEAALQDELCRFNGRFTSELSSANAPLLDSKSAKVREVALSNLIRVISSSLDIAVSPYPATNLLDMIALVELSSEAYERHWRPLFFGSAGARMSEAYLDAREQIWTIASRVLTPSQRNALAEVIANWLEKHPQNWNVEGVRLSVFSKQSEKEIDQESQKKVSGILSTIQGAIQSTDAVTLFGERALFYAQRAPFLFRLQTELAVARIPQALGISGQSQAAKNLMKGVNESMNSMTALMVQANDSKEMMQAASHLLNQLSELGQEWNRKREDGQAASLPHQMAGMTQRADDVFDRILKKSFFTGLILILFSGLTYISSRLIYGFLAERLLRRKS